MSSLLLVGRTNRFSEERVVISKLSAWRRLILLRTWQLQLEGHRDLVILIYDVLFRLLIPVFHYYGIYLCIEWATSNRVTTQNDAPWAIKSSVYLQSSMYSILILCQTDWHLQTWKAAFCKNFKWTAVVVLRSQNIPNKPLLLRFTLVTILLSLGIPL